MINLLKGDCLEQMKQIPSGSIDAIITDPPYGTTACKWDSVIPFEPMWEQLNRIIKPNGAIVLFSSEPFSSALRMSNIKNYRYDWVWVKEQGTGFLNSKKQPLKNNEQICVFYKKQPLYSPQMRQGFKPYKTKKGGLTDNYRKDSVSEVITESNGERYPLNTLEFKRDKSKQHPTQKPVALMEYLIKTYTNEGETVLDFTMGSGSTGVACKNLNRSFIGIELDDKYFEIAENRINNLK
jgi:DNA modification methylase